MLPLPLVQSLICLAAFSGTFWRLPCFGDCALYMSIMLQLFLVLLGANKAGLNFVFSGLDTLYINRTFLPAELRLCGRK